MRRGRRRTEDRGWKMEDGRWRGPPDEFEDIAMTDAARTIAQLLEAGAENDTAITSPGGVPLTYGALRMLIAHTVSTVNQRGIARNDRVAIVLDNGPEMAAAFLA